MKKTIFFAFLAFLACGAAFAQPAPATSAVDGTLGLRGGRIILASGDVTYYTRGLERFIGFIDGLKEGAQVSIEGYVSPPSLEGAEERLLFPVKLTLNGKEYEVGPAISETRGRPMASGRTGRGYEAGPPADETRSRRPKTSGGTGRDRRGCW
ncbi:MAG: hypothetical protein LBG14_02575 [Treponema sp.]|jgi:hypothetical protein|nr:hypothetical protein [Treponema sp.]